MFMCERCGSRYSAMHAATIENCPRCLARDRTQAPLTFKAFHLPKPIGVDQQNAIPDPAERAQAQDRAIST
jgi:DNA-directed RNA polymerase subunit RPC12/RpoP